MKKLLILFGLGLIGIKFLNNKINQLNNKLIIIQNTLNDEDDWTGCVN